MKLFLASLASTTLDLVIPLLPDKPSNLKVAFIPTAADPYIGQAMPWLDDDRAKLISMGFQVTDYDLKGKTAKSLEADLSQYQVIFMTGGNTFYLLNEIRKSGFDLVIKELLDRGVVYIGASAGSAVMGPDLSYLSTIDHPETVPELSNYTSLNFIEHRILPHAGREKYASRYTKIKEDWGEQVLFLRDDQALVINDDKIELVTIHGGL